VPARVTDLFHPLKSFREEFVDLLEKAGAEYDPRYLD